MRRFRPATPRNRNRTPSRSAVAPRPVLEEHGATMVEQAIALPLLLLIVVAIIDLCYMSYSALTLQFGLARAVRTISITGGGTPAVARGAVVDALRHLGVRVGSADSISYCPAELGSAGCPDNTIILGDRNQLMLLRIKKNPGSLFGKTMSSLYVVDVQAIGRNEPA